MAEMTIRRFSVFSVAKMQALLGFVVGLIIGVLYGLFFILFGAAITALAPREDQTAGGLGTVAIGILMMIGFPLVYMVIGFIGGAIGALVYNIAAGIVGGIKFDLEGATPAYAPPPPPQQWSANPYVARG